MKNILLLSIFILTALNLQSQYNVKVKVDTIAVLNGTNCDGAGASDFVFEFKATDNSFFSYSNNSPVAGSIGMCNYASYLNNNGPYALTPASPAGATFLPTNGIFFDRSYNCSSQAPTQITLTWRGYENDDSSTPSTVPTADGITSINTSTITFLPIITGTLSSKSYTAQYSETTTGGCVQTYVIKFSVITSIGSVEPLTVLALESPTVCTGSTATLSPVVVGGTGTITYDWSNDGLGDNDDLIELSGVGVGTYTFITKDALSCSVTATVTVSSVDAPMPLVSFTSSSPTVCTGTSGVLYTTNTFTNVNYVWNYSGAGASISSPSYSVNIDFSTAATSGVLSVFAQNSCSITPTLTMNINVNNTPTLSVAGSSTLCNNASETLTVTGATTYTWNTGAVTDNLFISPTSTTIYTVTGTYIGCFASKVYTVTSLPSPTVSISASTVAVCPNTNVVLNAVGSASSFVWSDTFVGATHTVSSAYTTTYVVTNTATNTCFATAIYSLVINPAPSILINGNATVCPMATSTLIASGANTYSWSTSVTTNSIIINPTGAATLSVIGTNTTTGCVSTKTLTIGVFIKVPTVVTGSTTICSATTHTYSATGSWLYLWNNGLTASTNTITPSTSTTINVIGTDLNGCKDTIYYPINVLISPTVTISGIDTICAGQQATLMANSSSAISYLWPGGNTAISNTVTPLTTTVFTVTISNGSCNGSASHTVNVKASPSISFTVPATICVDAPLYILNATPFGGTYTGASVFGNTFDAAAGIGSYPISYTIGATNGCVSSATKTMVVISCVGVEELENELAVSLFPNPTTQFVNIKTEKQITKLQVTDFTGKLIYTTDIITNNSVDISAFENGMYFFTLYFNASNSKTIKVIKQ